MVSPPAPLPPPYPSFAKKSLYQFYVTATGLEPRTTYFVNEHSTFGQTSSKEFLDIQEAMECEFTMKHVRDMMRTYTPSMIYSPNLL